MQIVLVILTSSKNVLLIIDTNKNHYTEMGLQFDFIFNLLIIIILAHLYLS